MPTIQTAVTKFWSAYFPAFLISLLLAGCLGGGGGGSGGGTTTDTTAPTVSSTSPASNATSVAINTTVSATFSEAMNSSTINTTTFTVSGVTGTVALSGNTATFTPSMNLTGSTTYTATITTGAQDTAGNALAAQQQWSFTTAAVPTFNISGTVTGPYVEGVTITMSGGATDTAVTNAMGVYSFATSRPAGSYTLTPALAGYTIPPQTVAITNANVVQDFTATSTVSSYSISGTVSLGTTTKSGRTRIQVFSTNCTGCSPIAGTSIATPGTGAYTIRGIPNGSYTVKASMGYLGTGAANATNPSGATGTVTVNSANVSGADIALADPSGLVATTPSGLQVFPANGAALILWDPVENANGTEKVTAYKIYWGTDTAATNGTPIIVGAQENAVYFQSGLTDGTGYYYKIASCVSDDLLCTAGEGTASAVEGPVTIGATSGSNTVTGAVTFPGTAAGPLWVVIYNPSTGSIQFNRIASPVSPQTYSIAGVSNGSLGAFILLDTNNNGFPDLGELSLDGDSSSNFTVSGNTTQNFTLSAASANATVGTRIFSDGVNPNGYSLQLEVREGTKRPVNATLVAGLNVPLPLDMGKDGSFRAYPWLGTTSPATGDTYVFKVTYSDGTSETLSRSVTAVLGSTSMAQNLVTQTTTPGTTTVPLFTWVAPASPPASYTYDVWVSDSTAGGSMWETDDRLPSTTTSVLYNADGNASSSSLMSGTTYNWQVTVEDANGNQATKQTTYTVP